MPSSAGPNTVSDSIVFNYDIGDVANSYKGEPTTNVMRQSNNVTGTQYGYNDEYSTCELVKTWLPNIVAPIGVGATQLTQQAVNSIWHCLNWFDDSEDGKRCLSAYICPLTPGINNFTIGMVGDSSNSVIFNLDTGAITVGAGLSNANAFYNPVPGFSGWYRIGANIEGRVGGWVASIGLGQTATYTPSAPFKSFYICGIQYERNVATHCTQFTQAQTSRSTTQGLLDISGGSNTITLATSYDNNAQPYFDATDDFISLGSDVTFKTTGGWTVESIVYYNSVAGNYNNTTSPANFIGAEAIDYNSWYWSVLENKLALWNISPGVWKYGSTTLQSNTWYYVTLVSFAGGLTYQFYLNGVAEGGDHTTYSWNPSYSGLKIRYIGKGNNANTRLVNGRINMTKVYDRALTSTEIANNYRQYKTRFNLP